MKIWLEQVGKRYQRHWIFRDLSAEYLSGGKYALLGRNGSGKSTLLRIISGMQSATKGKIRYEHNGAAIEAQSLFRLVSFCAPGMEIPEELNLHEFLDFHFSYKKILPGLTKKSIIESTGLGRAANKPLEEYSSGMKQRVKLAQAIFSDTPLLLLDEPCTNLDETGVEQYLDWINKYSEGRTVVIASNDVREYGFCESVLKLSDYQ
jgi:ABC-type multidrug transport system ATPase subunit